MVVFINSKLRSRAYTVSDSLASSVVKGNGSEEGVRKGASYSDAVRIPSVSLSDIIFFIFYLFCFILFYAAYDLRIDRDGG